VPIFHRQPRPFRIVLRWQLIAIAVLTSFAALLWGLDGAISAALGGGINVIAGWTYGWRVAQAAPTAGETLRVLFRAWAYKLVLIVGLTWGVLTQYREVVHAAFFLAFAITVGVFAAAIAVRDTDTTEVAKSE
jgi:F0F1-type ATP synthase assembly protein I